MKKKYDIIFVGCGTANTFALLNLIKNNYKGNIAVIEKGKGIYSRSRKEVMHGFLGAGLYSDAKIILSENTGGNIKEFISAEHLPPLKNNFLNLLKEFHSTEFNIIKPPSSKEKDFYPFTVLTNETLHMGSEYGEKMGKKIYDYLCEQKNIDFMFDCEVKMIHNINNEYHVIFTKENIDEIVGKKVVIGTGRSGNKFMNSIIQEYHLPTQESYPTIGVRVEVPFEITQKLTDMYYDFKFILKCPDTNIEARSFCVSPKGLVITEETYGLSTFNGGSYKENENQTKKTNFGIMNVPPIPNDYNSAFEYQLDIVGRANKLPIAERITNFSKWEMSNIYKNVFGENIYLTLTHWMKNFDTICPNFLNNVLIHVPEVKYVSHRISLDEKLQVKTCDNMFVVGDVVGISRGIYQAVLSGLYVSNIFLKE